MGLAVTLLVVEVPSGLVHFPVWSASLLSSAIPDFPVIPCSETGYLDGKRVKPLKFIRILRLWSLNTLRKREKPCKFPVEQGI
jgi:hypothetical protein